MTETVEDRLNRLGSVETRKRRSRAPEPEVEFDEEGNPIEYDGGTWRAAHADEPAGESFEDAGHAGKGNTDDHAATDGVPADPSQFTLGYWLNRNLPEPDYLLGDLVTTTSRVLLIGPTGIGKTNLGLATAVAMAAGSSFLHWAARRPARVLYIDGEMSARLMKDRLQGAKGRQGSVSSTLWTINREDFPSLPPLNAGDGQKFAEWIIERIGGVDVIVFDNIQSLLIGSHKEDETWAPMLPWIRDLTRRRVGQLWLHHTGHDTSKGYGDKTREWEFDTVALMRVSDAPTPGRLIEFRLEFTKARERTPSNRADFEPVDIWIDESNRWQSSASPMKPRKMPSPTAQTYYRELCNITAQIGEPNLPFRGAPPAVTRAVWLDQMVHRGSINEGAEPNVKQAHLSKYQAQLIDVRWIAVSGKYVWPIRILGQGENWSSGDGCSGGKQPSSNHPLSRQKQP